jgi:23S rRNA pseudouridine1911/1915/1917 synthase
MSASVVSRSLTASDDDAGLRLDQFLARHLPDASRSQIQRWIRDGCVTVSRGHAKPALEVSPGLVAEVTIPGATPAAVEAEALPIRLLYEDEDIAVVDKPAGMVVHPGAGHARGTLVNALLHHLGGLSGVGGRERPGIVHRLDRGTSGVLVIAKHDRAHRALARQFHDRKVEKEYLALVWGTPRAGETMDRPIGRDPRHRQKMSSRSRRTRTAVTRVVDVEPLGGLSLIRVTIRTGRTHQIRVHLGEAGHPVAGDALYGGARRGAPGRLAAAGRLSHPFLHAARLAFSHPADGRPLAFEAPLPGDRAELIEALRRSASGTRSGLTR